jgi:hypothetical protein
LKSCPGELSLVDLYPDANPKIPGLIGSLADFQKLEIIEISYHTIVQPYYDGDFERSQVPYWDAAYLVDILPQSIKKLILLHCSEDIVQQLDEFVEQSSERFPALKAVILIAN